MIPFTRRELGAAWRGALYASRVVSRSNHHRLLLFYAAECGLKAVYLKRRNCEYIDGELGNELKHDLNRVMSMLRIGREYFLPDGLSLAPFKTKDKVEKRRLCEIGALNQVWRYGGTLVDSGDLDVEKALEKINEWIAKEIQ